MSIKIRFFASLKEQYGELKTMSLNDISSSSPVSVSDIWHHLCSPVLPDNILASVNLEYVKPDYIVRKGDEVAFFPPVTGG